ncbi:MAG TPA: hypothetical protein ENH10_07960 [Bacteroidetes bacterium]|nr:hypothetical protein [Bacteroidota bacterium]HEX05072.1 hypothetical protein [Bacteroidota bacterium]
MNEFRYVMMGARSVISFAIITLLLAGAYVYAQDAPKTTPPPKSPDRSTQPLDIEQKVLLNSVVNDGPFGFGRATFGEGEFGQEVTDGEGEIDELEPEMSFQLSWTSCKWHRSNSDEPAQAILQGTFTSDVPMIWSLHNGEDPEGLLTLLPFIENVTGIPGQGQDVPLEWEYRLDGGWWIPLQQESYGFSILIPQGSHGVELKVIGYLPYTVDDGYYRLYMVQELIPQL